MFSLSESEERTQETVRVSAAFGGAVVEMEVYIHGFYSGVTAHTEG